MLFCETQSCYAHRHNDLERHSNSQYNLRISLNSTKEQVWDREPLVGSRGEAPVGSLGMKYLRS